MYKKKERRSRKDRVKNERPSITNTASIFEEKKVPETKKYIEIKEKREATLERLNQIQSRISVNMKKSRTSDLEQFNEELKTACDKLDTTYETETSFTLYDQKPTMGFGYENTHPSRIALYQKLKKQTIGAEPRKRKINRGQNSKKKEKVIFSDIEDSDCSRNPKSRHLNFIG